VRVVAALYDVHGNLPALEAVLADPRCAAADLIVSGGDLVAGPMPAECVDRLAAEGERVRYLMGNCDRETVWTTTDDPGFAESVRWSAARLGDDRLGRIAAWPGTVEVGVSGTGTVLFCHGTPTSDTAIVTSATPEADVAAELAGVTAEVVVCGHTHVQYDRSVGEVRVVNAGSVGMPYERSPDARWALVSAGRVELVSTPYDAEAALELLSSKGCPALEWFSRPLRGEVTAEEATAHFESRRRGA
jgi:predicted phosphodiesterase